MSSKAAEGRSTSGRSRRELLAGAAGALGVVAAESLTRITPAEAGVDGDVVLGVDNQLTAGTTGVQSTASLALHGRSTASSGTGVVGDGNTVGVHGTGLATNSTGVEGIGGTGVVGKGLGTGSGVLGLGGSSGSGTGVEGIGGNNGPGVNGTGVGTGRGVVGTGGSTSGTALYGTGGTPNGTGVVGNGAGTGTGVFGFGGGSGGNGVVAQGGNNSGTGLVAQGGGPKGDGVSGTGLGSGTGVSGHSATATGVGMVAENTGGGTALQVSGPSRFSRSGTVVIPSGVKTATVTPPGGLTSSALVLALMQNVAGGVMVKAAVPNPGAGTVQITLNKAPLSPATATVAWFVVN